MMKHIKSNVQRALKSLYKHVRYNMYITSNDQLLGLHSAVSFFYSFAFVYENVCIVWLGMEKKRHKNRVHIFKREKAFSFCVMHTNQKKDEEEGNKANI